MTGTPQLIITLSPDQTQLQAELPGVNGARRIVSMAHKDFVSSCLKILQGLARGKTEIGLDGAPTQQQVRHWERHSIFPDDHCPFCLNEKKVSAQRRQQRVREHFVGDGSVTVRRIPAGSKKEKPERSSSASLTELGI